MHVLPETDTSSSDPFPASYIGLTQCEISILESLLHSKECRKNASFFFALGSIRVWKVSFWFDTKYSINCLVWTVSTDVLCKKQKPSPTFTYSWDPWDERYIYLHEWLIFMGFHVRYKFTRTPLDAIMGHSTFICLSPPSRDLPIHHSEFGWGDLASVDWQLEGGRDMGGPFFNGLKKDWWLGVG